MCIFCILLKQLYLGKKLAGVLRSFLRVNKYCQGQKMFVGVKKCFAGKNVFVRKLNDFGGKTCLR